MRGLNGGLAWIAYMRLWPRVENFLCFVVSKLRRFLLAEQNRVEMRDCGSNLAWMISFFRSRVAEEVLGIGRRFPLNDGYRRRDFVLFFAVQPNREASWDA
jgi:hypothetical protein